MNSHWGGIKVNEPEVKRLTKEQQNYIQKTLDACIFLSKCAQRNVETMSVETMNAKGEPETC